MKIASEDYRVEPGKKVKLDEWPTEGKAVAKSKEDYQELLDKHVSELSNSPTVNAVAQGDGRTQTEIARLHSQLLHWARWFGGQNGGLGSDIDGKVLGAHADVDARTMAGDWCFHLRLWSGKGKNLIAHVMTHYLGWPRYG